MIAHWTIKILNAIFVFSIGLTIIWLFRRALIAGSTLMKTQARDVPLRLNILRGGAPYLSILLKRKRYLIGRDSGCDITLKGIGLPPRVCEVNVCGSYCLFNFSVDTTYHVSIGRQSAEGIKMEPRQEMALGNYVLQIERDE